MQEILTYIIIASAVFVAVYKFYKSVKISRDCDNSSLSCASCSLKENCSQKLIPIKINIK
jgi:hypothetical protein